MGWWQDSGAVTYKCPTATHGYTLKMWNTQYTTLSHMTEFYIVIVILSFTYSDYSNGQLYWFLIWESYICLQVCLRFAGLIRFQELLRVYFRMTGEYKLTCMLVTAVVIMRYIWSSCENNNEDWHCAHCVTGYLSNKIVDL